MKNLYWQPPAIEFLKATGKGILALRMGMGKSRCALLAIPEEAERVLIICPSIAVKNWVKEIEKWHPALLQDLKLVLSGKDNPKDGKVVICSYAMYTRLGPEKFYKPDVAILDESHYFKNNKAKRTKAIKTLIKAVKRVYMLTGTPVLNRPIELFPVLQALGIQKNYRNYVFRFCDGFINPWGGLDARGASDLAELKKLLDPIMFVRTEKDLEGYTPGRMPTRIVELDLPVDIREKKLNKAEIIKNPNALIFETVSDIMHQSALRKVPKAIEYIKDVLEMEEKVVVFCRHLDVVAELHNALIEYGVISITGKSKDKFGNAELFNMDRSIRVMIANYEAGGVAISLTASAYVVFVECPWTPAIIDQAIARCDRLGQMRKVVVDILTISQSIDANVLHAIIDKVDIINQIVQETEIMGKVKEEKKPALCLNGLVTQLDKIKELTEGLISDISEFANATSEPEVDELEAELNDVEEEVITFDVIRQKLAAVMRTHGSERVKEILADFEAKKLSDLHEDDYPAVFKRANRETPQ